MRIVRPKAAALEAISPKSGGSFAVRRFVSDGFPYNWHYHPEIELTWIVRGAGMRFVGVSIETFAAGDVVLIGSNVPHTWQSSGEAGAEGVESVVAQFPLALVERMGSVPEMRGLAQLMVLAGRGVVVRAGAVRELIQRELGEMAGSAGTARSLASLVRCLAELSLAKQGTEVAVLGGGPMDWSEARGPQARVLEEVLGKVHRALARGEQVRQADVAGWAGTSAASFSRMFHRELGRPFTRYVNEWRVGLACQALVTTDRPITEIAFDAGFGNLSNFNRRFRDIKGATPGEFRRAAR